MDPAGPDCTMADAIFTEPRLAAIYDALDGDRTDLDLYVELVDEVEGRSVLDLGCGTGSLACQLASRGIEVVGVDPAAASLAMARRKPHAERVRWHEGDATTLPPSQVDVATMTGNVAQVFLDDAEWQAALRALQGALRPGGTLLFEVRDPARHAWREWTRDQSYRQLVVPGSGAIETWVEVTDLRPPFVSFLWTFVFGDDGATLTSASTLRFRSRDEITASVERAGFQVVTVRDAPDRPGLEFVFHCRKADA
jgi:SAM-dependent methyltransferase